MAKKKCTACNGAGSKLNVRVTCPSCGGFYGNTSCGTCTNSGYIYQNQSCSPCNGTGWIEDKCYITTATMVALKKPDNCKELETFREFRDNYMLANHSNDVLDYYKIAPLIVDAIDQRLDAVNIYKNLWVTGLKPAYEMILLGNNLDAYLLYRESTLSLKNNYLPKN